MVNVSKFPHLFLKATFPEKLYIDSVSVFSTKDSLVEYVEAKADDGSWKTILRNIESSEKKTLYSKNIPVRYNSLCLNLEVLYKLRSLSQPP